MSSSRWGMTAILIAWIAMAAHGKTYHVSPGGDDAGPGTANTPWRTLAHATAAVQPGDTVHLGPGIYREAISLKRGGRGPDATVRFVGGVGVVLDGREVDANHGFYAKGLDHLVLEDIVFRNWSDEGIRIDDAEHVRIERCVVSNSGIDSGRFRNGVMLRRVSYFIVRDCRFVNNFRSGIEVDMGEYGLIERCLATDNNGDAPFGGYHDDADGINLQNSRHIRVAQCETSYNGEDGIDVGIWEGFEGDSEDVFVTDSVAHHHPGKGLCVSGSNDPSFKARNVRFIRCVSYGNDPENRLGKEGLGFQGYENASEIRLVHCTIADNFRNVKFDSGSGGVLLINNSINFPSPSKYNLDVTKAMSPVRVSHTNWFDSVPKTGAGETFIDQNPRFVDHKRGDYALLSDSPNRDAGGFLTYTTKAGTGDTIQVADAGFFSDGWGWIGGDTIQIDGESARVLKVHAPNRIVLDRKLSWSKGDGVSFPFAGSRPDLGAYETGADNAIRPMWGPAPLTWDALADQVETVLMHHDVNWWFPRSVDPDGGFFETYDKHDQPTIEEYRTTVFQARMTWTAAVLAEHLPEHRERFTRYALHGARYLREHLADPEHGGYFWARSPDGRPVDRWRDDKHVYATAFAIYALAAVEKAAPGHGALEAAQEAFDWLESHAYDNEHGGYLEALTGDGQPMLKPQNRPDPARTHDAIGTRYGDKSMNSHLHLMEAFVELYTVWPDEHLRRRIGELESLHRENIYADPGGLHMFFSRDWQPRSDRTSFGHNVEAAHLLWQSQQLLGRSGPEPRALVDHALIHGWDERFGGFFNEGSFSGEIHDRAKAWWAQAEGLYALMLMHELYGQDAPIYRQRLTQLWQFIAEHQLDWDHGNWYTIVREDGTPKPDERKATHWKAGYHTTRALLAVRSTLRTQSQSPGAINP